jgi:hypothetical protein
VGSLRPNLKLEKGVFLFFCANHTHTTESQIHSIVDLASVKLYKEESYRICGSIPLDSDEDGRTSVQPRHTIHGTKKTQLTLCSGNPIHTHIDLLSRLPLIFVVKETVFLPEAQELTQQTLRKIIIEKCTVPLELVELLPQKC